MASYTGKHDAAETDPVATEHVECTDCHNPHAVNATGGAFPGSLGGTRGITITGAPINPATSEYQICFRCHADGAANVPVSAISRQIVQNNKRLEFQTTNPSFHPIAGVGRSTNVPSLIGPTWTTSSLVKCTDCHNNNTGPGAGGTGPNGPHGSTYKPLLERQYLTADNTPESAANYALCYKCHSQSSILSDASFKAHNMHVRGGNMPCASCHDPHGISATQGNSINNSHLINLNTALATPYNGQLKYESQGVRMGQCYLVCHGKQHTPCFYTPTNVSCR